MQSTGSMRQDGSQAKGTAMALRTVLRTTSTIPWMNRLREWCPSPLPLVRPISRTTCGLSCFQMDLPAKIANGPQANRGTGCGV